MSTCGQCAWWLSHKYTKNDRAVQLTEEWGDCRNEHVHGYSMDHDAPKCPKFEPRDETLTQGELF